MGDISQIVDSVLYMGVLAAGINQLLSYMRFIDYSPAQSINPNYSTIKVPDERILTFGNLPGDFIVIDYLNLANSIVHTASINGVCRDFAIATYDVYMKLVELNQKSDLKAKLRFAIGYSDGGHILLEYNDAGIFRPYETTLKTPPLEVSQVKAYSSRTKTEKMMPLKWVFARSSIISNRFHPELGALFFPGGLLRVKFARRNSSKPL